jgi:hypothetical protein
MSTLIASNLQASGGGGTAALLSSVNGGPLAGMRNLLINGNPIINQRGYVSGTATSGANQYTLDRWRVVTSGQSITFTDSANVRTVTAPAGGIEQVIEGLNILSGTYVLNWTGTATATVDGASVAKGGIVTLTGGTNCTVRFSGGTFSLPQLEPGTVATPFERRSYGQELSLCQRYYEKSYLDSVAPGSITAIGQVVQTTFGDGAGAHFSGLNFIVPKRSDPTVIIYNPNTGGTPNVQVYAGSYTGGAAASVSQTSPARTTVGSVAYSIGSASVRLFHYTASAEL